MPRPQIAPRYVNIEMQVVMDENISAKEKEIYMYLKALAHGKREVTFAVSEFIAFFGVPRSTMYRHLSRLSKSAVLRFESPGKRTTGLIYVEFLVDPNKSWIDARSELTELAEVKEEIISDRSSPGSGTPNPKSGNMNPKNETPGSITSKRNPNDETPTGVEVIPENETFLLTTATAKESNINIQREVVVEGGTGGKSQNWKESQKRDDTSPRESLTEQSDVSQTEILDPFPFKRINKIVEDSYPKDGDSRSQICQRILNKVTGWFALPGTWDQENANIILWKYYQYADLNEEAAAKAIERYLVEWVTRGYNPTNPAWLTDWAATRFIPKSYKSTGRTKGVKYDEDGLSPVERKLKELKASHG